MNKGLEKSYHRYRLGLLLAQYICRCIILCWWPHDFGCMSWWFKKNVGSMWGIYLLTPYLFNPAKTQLIDLVQLWISPVARLLFSVVSVWQCLTQWFTWVTTCTSMDFIKQASSELLRFNFADSILKTCLFQSYCLGFYGGVLWHLSLRQIKALEVSYNNIFCCIWSLPCVSHSY